MIQKNIGFRDTLNTKQPVNILIVDDEQLARQNNVIILENISKKYAREQKQLQFTIAEVNNGVEALEFLDNTDVDIVIVDIQMPIMNGFDFIKALQSQDRKMPAIIFVTAFDKYAVKAFEVSATDYVLKPFTFERFEAAFSRALQHLESHQHKIHFEELLDFVNTHPLFDFTLEQETIEDKYWQRLTLPAGKRNVIVSMDKVLWISSAESYIEIHLEDATYLLRGSLRKTEAHLDPKIFVRVHRSAIVNVNYVKAIEYNSHGDGKLLLTNEQEIKFSRYQKEEFLKALGDKL